MMAKHAGNDPEKQLLDRDRTWSDEIVNSPWLRVPEIEFSLNNRFTSGNSEYLDGIGPVSRLL